MSLQFWFGLFEGLCAIVAGGCIAHDLMTPYGHESIDPKDQARYLMVMGRVRR